MLRRRIVGAVVAVVVVIAVIVGSGSSSNSRRRLVVVVVVVVVIVVVVVVVVVVASLHARPIMLVASLHASHHAALVDQSISGKSGPFSSRVMPRTKHCQHCWQHRCTHRRLCIGCERLICPGCEPEQCLARDATWGGANHNVCRSCWEGRHRKVWRATAHARPRALDIVINSGF